MTTEERREVVWRVTLDKNGTESCREMEIRVVERHGKNWRVSYGGRKYPVLVDPDTAAMYYEVGKDGENGDASISGD